MFNRTSSRGARGRRADVDFVVCFGCAGLRAFFRFSFFERTRPAASMRTPCFIYLYNSTGVRTECNYLIYLSAGLSACLFISLCMCNIRRVIDCEICTRPISTSLGSMEAGEHGLTCGTCFVACRLKVVTVAELLWRLWCVFGAARFISCFP